MSPPSIGAQLYAELPEVYRTRDKDRDLERYLDACGELLDGVYAALRQRLDDNFPDTCQEWLIPYFADLVDVLPRSPEHTGRRREVASGIAWRQRKGTAACTEDLAEAVGAMEVELQEGWRRVARTARPGEKPLPAALFGAAGDPDRKDPLVAGQHPGLPVATVDLRRYSRAQQVDKRGLFTRATRFPGKAGAVLWEQKNPHGAPCFPGSYEDRSVRTVDLRTPDWRRGQFHPKRLLAFVPVPEGFFPAAAKDPLGFEWANLPQAIDAELIEKTTASAGRTTYRRHPKQVRQSRAVQIKGPIGLNEAVPAGEERIYRFEDLNIDDTLTITRGQLELDRCTAKAVVADTPDADTHSLAASDCVLQNVTLKQGRLRLDRCAVSKVIVDKNDRDIPVLTATDCLLQDLQATDGLVQLECCTVLAKTVCRVLQAIDSLFAGDLQRDLSATPAAPEIVCLSYVRVPASLRDSVSAEERKRIQRYTTEVPVFYSSEFGAAGAGVLHPATPASIREGAEDGGELGAYHHQRLSLRWEAVRDKFAEYLPFGMEAVLIPDARLSCAPPTQKATPG